MTFLELQNAVMNRLNLTTAEARTRIKTELNLRNAEVTSGVGMEKVRRATVVKDTIIGDPQLTYANVAHVFTIFDPVHIKGVLREVSMNDIREEDADQNTSGYPRVYAIANHLKDSMTITLYPKPSTISTLRADVLALGTDMVADGDAPAFPVDFHDVLVHGVLYDEALKIERQTAYQKSFKLEYETRRADLRYFLAKRAYFSRKQNSRDWEDIGTRRWGPMGVP